jgi:DNA modification methylase
MKNTLYYSDNLAILREHIPTESVDLIYLDPPTTSITFTFPTALKVTRNAYNQAKLFE